MAVPVRSVEEADSPTNSSGRAISSSIMAAVVGYLRNPHSTRDQANNEPVK